VSVELGKITTQVLVLDLGFFIVNVYVNNYVNQLEKQSARMPRRITNN
jgi:hypothetical protein